MIEMDQAVELKDVKLLNESAPPSQYSSSSPPHESLGAQISQGNPQQQQQQAYGAPVQPQAGYSPVQPSYPPAQTPPPSYGQTIQNTPHYSTTTIVEAPRVVTMSRPNNYMGLACFVFFFCFWPTALIAFMKASQVNSAIERGDHQAAQRYSEEARGWSIISIIIGVVIVGVAVIYNILY